MKSEILSRVVVYEDGRVYSKKYNRFLYVCINNAGYCRVWINGRRHWVHRLVAAVFLGDIRSCEVHHIDGNKENNHVDNLRIVNKTQHEVITYEFANEDLPF